MRRLFISMLLLVQLGLCFGQEWDSIASNAKALSRGQNHRESIAVILSAFERTSWTAIQKAEGHKILMSNYRLVGPIDSALHHGFEALALVKTSKDLQLEMAITNNLGNIYNSGLADYSTALWYYEKALNLLNQLDYPPNGFARVYNNMAAVQMLQYPRNYEAAIRIKRRILELPLSAQDPLRIKTLISIAELIFQHGQGQNGVPFIQEVNALQKTTWLSPVQKEKLEHANGWYAISNGDLKKAETYFTKHLRKTKETAFAYSSIAQAYYSLAHLAILQEQPELFLRNLDSSIHYSNQHFSKQRIDQSAESTAMHESGTQEEIRKLLHEQALLAESKLDLAREQNAFLLFWGLLTIGLSALIILAFYGIKKLQMRLLVQKRELHQMEFKAILAQGFSELREAQHQTRVQQIERIGQVLHDDVASQLTALHFQLEAIQNPALEILSRRVRDFHQFTRRMSHVLLQPTYQPFFEQFLVLCSQLYSSLYSIPISYKPARKGVLSGGENWNTLTAFESLLGKLCDHGLQSSRIAQYMDEHEVLYHWQGVLHPSASTTLLQDEGGHFRRKLQEELTFFEQEENGNHFSLNFKIKKTRHDKHFIS